MASEGFHESESQLSDRVKDHHRAISSIMEEFEAVDWYDQRVEMCADPDLAAILAHNRDEEKEHAAMVLEWLRRQDPQVDEMLRKYLFTSSPIVGIEEVATASAGGEVVLVEVPSTRAGDGSLGIGGLKASLSTETAREGL